LRALEGHAQILLRDYGGRLDECAREHLERIRSASRKMDALIHDLLIYTTLSRTDIALEPVDLDPLVAALVEEGGWTDDVSIRSPLGAVRGHRELLSRALENLLENACKFTARSRKTDVRVRSERRGDKLRLWVEDNGPGIEPDLIPKIFKPFERGHAGESGGTGIGLAIVKRTASRLGGSVGVESEPGKGSRFWLELPRA
jgi:signal transduction histidine kinase